MKYIIALDQSTQGTKGLLLDEGGSPVCRVAKSHEQIVLPNGYVEHRPEEIYQNVLWVVRELIKKSGVAAEDLLGVGISNQRETALAWHRKTGVSFGNAVVWQCGRGEAICQRIAAAGHEEAVRQKTGLRLSPYFSAAKIAWILENREDAKAAAREGNFLCGTMDSYLIYRLTGGKEFRTDVSNASRTQLMNLTDLDWDADMCDWFGIRREMLPEISSSDSLFGMTDFEGTLDREIPIHGVLGDSHAALFGHGCRKSGQMKTTYGTGSSIMMNIGEKPVWSRKGLVTSLAWRIGGRTEYVLEGNINYTGAVMTWAVKDLGLLSSAAQADELAFAAAENDTTYIVPAFTGLGAPYWDTDAKAMIYGMGRQTGKAELVRAVDECIAYQVADIVKLMEEESGFPILEVRADGGASRGEFLMGFQSDILNVPVYAAENEEISGTGAGLAAGFGLGFYDESVFRDRAYREYKPRMSEERRRRKYEGWKDAVRRVLMK